MTFIVILLAIATVSALSFRFGADSRQLSDQGAANGTLWSR